ncbi:MAG: hypothetical protein EKK29_19870 [Hyphomicrobiales bacterium]|nr:MAG: hypothetical protein EKK29_19870 [Hyphomicrobiales bacterium]
MTDTSKAWVWSQYCAVVPDDEATAKPLPLFGRGAPEDKSPTTGDRTKRGLILAGAMIIGLFFPKIAFLLLVLSALMILSGLEPKRFEDFMETVPGGGVVLKILAISEQLF